MEMRTDYPDIPVTTVAIASAVRRKIVWKVTAKEKKTKESGVSKKQDEGTSVSSWLLTLSSEEIREAQLRDPCLGAFIRLKEQGPEHPAWETISMEGSIFKRYLLAFHRTK